MITVKIEIWPMGDESTAREIGRMYIANDGSRSQTDPKRGDYEVAVCRRGSDAVPAPINPDGPKATRTGQVHDYPRLSYNVWRLIARACLAAFPEERIPKGTVPGLDAQVMEGLRQLLGWAVHGDDNDSLHAAHAWLSAAFAEGDK